MEINYSEVVKLSMPGANNAHITLAHAVRKVMHEDDPQIRLAAVIVLDKGRQQIKHQEIAEIYSRSDFPISN